ncbi:LysR family transcriptional regulator [Bordetella tumbae]|uniref:LysR family transcriptional regulator n=1 Tax=Bordetella tumbae TaxID=1649139 RepID=UPI0039F020A7
MHIDFLGIQAFLAIVETGSFQLAATELNLSQTAVSHRMRKLEETLGVKLIARTTRDVTLTEAGRALLPTARSAVKELGMSCDAIRKHGQNAPDWLAFACLPSLSHGLVSPLLLAAKDRWPDALVRVFDTSVREMVELLESRVVSFGVSVLQQGYGDLQVESIGDEHFVLACPPQHRFAQQPNVDCSTLENESMIRISLTSGNSATIDSALGHLRERLRWRYEALHNAMALDMVRAGLGLAIVPRLFVPPNSGVAVVPIKAPIIKRTLCLLSRGDDTPSAQEQWLRDQAMTLLKMHLTTKEDDSYA